MAKHTYLRTHDLSGEHLLIDLGEAVTDLHSDSEGQDRRGVTLVKQGGLSVVLTHLHAGATLQEHAAPGAATVQVLDGRVHARVGDQEMEVPHGRVLAFDSNVRHSIEALEDSTLLLTLADPGSDGRS
ncbi:MAG: cupin domain-containing protein [Dehalococcoidia bacterium]|nr:cupin domain-containing protein [Dehalococcoidia bacterium]